MKDKIKLSVIIPVWNQELLVYRALDSIPKRKDIEIILIDDFSTDNTVDTILKFKKEKEHFFSNIILIKNSKNLGVGATVNKGCDEAKGEYILMLGSDDYLYPKNCEEIIDNYLDGTDIVYFNLESNDKQEWDLNSKSRKGLCGAVKFIRRNFMGTIRCPSTRRGEDWAFNNELLSKNPTEYFTHKIMKHYNYPRIGSLSNPIDFIYGLSIIIPAYNTLDNLKKILKKLIYQKNNFYPETEIIVINDGSIEDYSEIEEIKGIVYVKQDNQGAAAARNVGLEMATRSYITFIDSDDNITDDYLHTIYSNFKNQKIIYRLNWYIKNKDELIGETKIIPQDKKMDIIYTARSVMCYVYNHNFIRNKKFDTNYIVNEDYNWLVSILPEDANLYTIIDKPIYIYNLSNEESLTHRYNRGEIPEKKKED